MALLLGLALCIRTCTDLCFKYSVHHIHFRSLDTFFPTFCRLFLLPIFWVSIGLGAFNFVLWAQVLSYYDLSYAYPLFSICFVFIMLGGKLFFNEHLDHYKVIGMVCIGCAAILMLWG